MKTIQQLLSAMNMIGTIQGIRSGIPNPFPPEFFSMTRTVTGDYGTYTLIEGTRETARMVQYGAPSVRRALKGVKVVPVKLIHSFEHQFHDPMVLQNLLRYDRPEVQQLGSMEIARQTAEFRQLFDNLRTASLAMTLNLGFIYFDADGNLLPSSGSAVVSVDFQIPSGNKDQLDVFAAGAIIGAKWSAAGTDIVGQVAAIRDASLQKTGYPLEVAYYGENVLGYLLGNTSISALAKGNPAIAASLLQNEIPDGLLGLRWRRVAGVRYTDHNGTSQSLWHENGVTFCPAPSRDWYELLEGTYPVPTNIGTITADALEAIQGGITLARGIFQYAQVLSDPSTVKHLAGDTMLPVIKVPGAVFQARVHW